MAFSFMLPNYYGNASTSLNTPTPPTSGTGTGNVSAVSIGTSGGGFGGLTPNLAYAAPGTVGDILDFYSNNVYSVPAGGYISSEATRNANSPEIKFGGTSPGSMAEANQLFGYLGSLPTMPYSLGSAALNALYARTGIGTSGTNLPGGGSSYPPGPSINSILGRSWQGPWAIKPSEFTSTPLAPAYGG